MGVSGAIVGGTSPLSYSNSSSGSPSPYLLAPCGSVFALFPVPRRGHLQPPLPSWDQPAPPSCPLHPPRHPSWPAAARPCPPQPASRSPAGPLTPGPCLPPQPAGPSPPTALVLTQPPWGSVPAASLLPGPGACPHPSLGPLSERALVPDPGPRGGHSASSVGIQGFQAGPVHGASILGWPGA